MYLTRLCPEVRIRETRRVIGDYILTAEDVAEARKFDDVIGKSSFPSGPKACASVGRISDGNADQRHGGKTSEGRRFQRYSLPLSGGKGIENLLVAGKAISTDRPSHNRFLQQTFVTGQAAGCAAAGPFETADG